MRCLAMPRSWLLRLRLSRSMYQGALKGTVTYVATISRAIGATVPELVSWKWTKSERRGLARLDYTQNQINKTLVAPYSLRPAAGAPVSVPLEWDELDDPELRPFAAPRHRLANASSATIPVARPA